jgi:phosphatidylglycerol:prolipoprotein diacylglycerol transferase
MPWSYPLIMLAAVATGVLLSRGRQQTLGLTRQERIGIGIGAFCGAMIGAKIPFLIADWPGLISGSAWFDNGKTILCGLVGGYFGVEIAKWALEIRVKTGDSFAVPVAAAVAVGRLSCFVAGCCYGTHTTLPWGVDFCSDGPRHPTQLYEAGWHAMSAVILAGLQKRGLFRGQLMKLYILAYLGFRFVTEFIRPEPRLWLGLTAYQWGALGLMPVFVGLWIRDRRLLAEDKLTAKPQA